MFGLTEPQIARFGMTFGLGAFMVYMMFVIARLARQSGAGPMGTFVLFLVLGLGMVGFVAKSVIQWWLER